MIYYVLMTTIGSVIGCHFLFWAGRRGGRSVLESRFKESSVKRAETFITRYGVYSVMIPSIMPPPMPFKVFVLTAGVFQMNPWQFFTAVAAGRSIRYFTWGILAVLYGVKVKEFMLENMKVVGVILLLLLAVGVGYMLIRSYWKKDCLTTAR